MKIESKSITLACEREKYIAKLVEDHGWRDGFAVLDARRGQQGATSFVLLEPALRMWGDLLGSYIERAGGEKLRFEESLEALQGELISSLWREREAIDLPIIAGYLSYELAHLIEVLPYPVNDQLRLPLYTFFAYRKILEIPHGANYPCKVHLVDAEWASAALWEVDLELEGEVDPSLAKLAQSVVTAAREPADMALNSCEVYSNFSEGQYRAAVAQAQEWIKVGEVYQVNFTQRFELPYEGSPELYYLILRKINPAAHAAYFRFSGFPGVRGFAIASISPELFMGSDGREVLVSPIKGTSRRGASEQEDLQLIDKLRSSEKDIAELSMIVDLMRNDLSKIAECGSVSVRQHARVETHPTLHHLVSDVICYRKPEISFLDVVRAMFPCGSITGAPKIAAMKCISHLERSTRGVYCGAIGYIGSGGAFKFSVAIRTVLLREKKMYVSAGGGVVADSVPAEEYQESLVKAISMLTAWRLAQQISQQQRTEEEDQAISI